MPCLTPITSANQNECFQTSTPAKTQVTKATEQELTKNQDLQSFKKYLRQTLIFM